MSIWLPENEVSLGEGQELKLEDQMHLIPNLDPMDPMYAGGETTLSAKELQRIALECLTTNYKDREGINVLVAKSDNPATLIDPSGKLIKFEYVISFQNGFGYSRDQREHNHNLSQIVCSTPELGGFRMAPFTNVAEHTWRDLGEKFQYSGVRMGDYKTRPLPEGKTAHRFIIQT